jgi:hypothetical protein
MTKSAIITIARMIGRLRGRCELMIFDE